MKWQVTNTTLKSVDLYPIPGFAEITPYVTTGTAGEFFNETPDRYRKALPIPGGSTEKRWGVRAEYSVHDAVSDQELKMVIFGYTDAIADFNALPDTSSTRLFLNRLTIEHGDDPNAHHEHFHLFHQFGDYDVNTIISPSTMLTLLDYTDVSREALSELLVEGDIPGACISDRDPIKAGLATADHPIFSELMFMEAYHDVGGDRRQMVINDTLKDVDCVLLDTLSSIQRGIDGLVLDDLNVFSPLPPVTLHSLDVADSVEVESEPWDDTNHHRLTLTRAFTETLAELNVEELRVEITVDPDHCRIENIDGNTGVHESELPELLHSIVAHLPDMDEQRRFIMDLSLVRASTIERPGHYRLTLPTFYTARLSPQLVEDPRLAIDIARQFTNSLDII